MQEFILKLHFAVTDLMHSAMERRREERGFTTAELLGNAALGIAALVFIWGLFEHQIGQGVVDFVKSQIGIK